MQKAPQGRVERRIHAQRAQQAPSAGAQGHQHDGGQAQLAQHAHRQGLHAAGQPAAHQEHGAQRPQPGRQGEVHGQEHGVPQGPRAQHHDFGAGVDKDRHRRQRQGHAQEAHPGDAAPPPRGAEQHGQAHEHGQQQGAQPHPRPWRDMRVEVPEPAGLVQVGQQ
ncbi:hypothetical protein G6F31_017561 [Rhizopus arrhizus]|nr:hypothetical protein G6F31_017561 [Rhizopus arrhizus]